MAQSNSSSFKPDDFLLRQWFAQMEDFKSNGTFCDITLQCQSKEISAHRVILAASIPFFSRMLQSNLRETTNKKVEIKEIVDPDILDNLINVSYGAKLEINQQNAEKLLIGSDYLQMNHVKTDCEDFLKSHLTPESVLKTKKIAEKLHCLELVSVAEKFIDNNFPDFAKTDEFMELEKHELMELIKRDELKVKEEEVYEAVMKWIKYEESERVSLLPEILSYVRLCLLSPVFLYDKVDNESLIKASSECRVLLDEALKYHLMKGIRDVPKNIRNRSRGTCLIYIVGGEINDRELNSTLQIYSPRDDRWTSMEFDKFETTSLSASVIFENKMYIFGGGDENDDCTDITTILDLKARTSVEAKSMDDDINSASAAVLGEFIYVVGGYDDEDELNLVSRYSPQLDTWTEVAHLNQKRSGAVVVSLNGYLYAIGGQVGRTNLNSCERYDPQSNTWTVIKSMVTPRDFPGAAVLNGKIYVCGGDTSIGTTTSSTEIYDPVTDVWTFAASMLVERSRFALVSCNGKLYAIGGRNRSSFWSTVEAYDIERNRWDFVESLPTPTFGMNYGVDF